MLQNSYGFAVNRYRFAADGYGVGQTGASLLRTSTALPQNRTTLLRAGTAAPQTGASLIRAGTGLLKKGTAPLQKAERLLQKVEHLSQNRQRFGPAWKRKRAEVAFSLGFGVKPAGFEGKPAGFESKPAGFEGKPSRFLAVARPREAFRPLRESESHRQPSGEPAAQTVSRAESPLMGCSVGEWLADRRRLTSGPEGPTLRPVSLTGWRRPRRGRSPCLLSAAERSRTYSWFRFRALANGNGLLASRRGRRFFRRFFRARPNQTPGLRLYCFAKLGDVAAYRFKLAHGRFQLFG